MSGRRWPVAVATHAARSVIGAVPQAGQPWAGLERFADWAAETGFDGVDLSTSVFPVGQDDAWWDRVAEVFSTRGLRMASINCLRSSLADEDYWLAGDRRVRRAVELAARLGIDSVNISLAVPPERLDANAYRQLALPPGSSRVATRQEVQRTIDTLRAIATDAPAGPDLVLELHHCSVVDTAPSLVAVIGELDGRFGANPDLVNELWAFDRVEAPWQQSLELLAPISRTIWHVKNCRRRTMPDGSARFEDAPLSAGDIDYVLAVDIMSAAGYQGWISLERAGDSDFLATAALGIAFLDALGHTHISGRSTS